jgi:hypothetical protein
LSFMIVYSGMIYSLCVTLGVTSTPHEIHHLPFYAVKSICSYSVIV